MNEIQKNNTVTVSGKLLSLPCYSHEIFGEKFYECYIECLRLSNIPDIIPITISEQVMGTYNFVVGDKVEFVGQYRSYNKLEGEHSKLMLTVFAYSVHYPLRDTDRNEITLEGFLCKSPVFRTTPFKREICDLLVAVNRGYNKSDYIPCIAWGKNARVAKDFNVGDRLQIIGRIQSRAYIKKLDDGTTMTKTAYELSIIQVSLYNSNSIETSLGTIDNYYSKTIKC